MNYNYSQLRQHYKQLNELAETTMKEAFEDSESHEVTQVYENHKGANFNVESRVGGSEKQYHVLCRQIHLGNTTYTFIPKQDLERGLRDDLYIGLVVFINDDLELRKFLIPSTVWNSPNALFTDGTAQHAEYGINLNKKTIAELMENYQFEDMILRF